MSETKKQEHIEELLRKSLLGDELINTQFHLFSAKLMSSGKVVKPRVVCGNNTLLAKSSKYFLDLLSSDIYPSELEDLIDVTGDNDIPGDVRIDDYGYGSDSDLDLDEDSVPQDTEGEKDQSTSAKRSSPPLQPSKRTKEDDGLNEDDSQSVSSEAFVVSLEAPGKDEEFDTKKQENESIASSETAVEENQEMRVKSASVGHSSVRLRSLGSRHILVKDTAFQTWYTLLNYLYTGKFDFLPLSSASTGSRPNPSSTSSLDEPKCSAKSMYRLASKVGLDDLRDEAFSYIRSNLTEHNILKELSCSLVSRHPSLLEMELDVLYSHIASPPVVAGFPALARRIANGELPQGGDIFIGIHTRFLKQPQLSAAEQPRSIHSLPSSKLGVSPPPTVKPPSGPSAAQPSVSSAAASEQPSLDSSAGKLFGSPFVAATPPLFGLSAGMPPSSSANQASAAPPVSKPSTSAFASATPHPPGPTFTFSNANSAPPPGPSDTKPLFSFARMTPPPGDPSASKPSLFTLGGGNPAPSGTSESKPFTSFFSTTAAPQPGASGSKASSFSFGAAKPSPSDSSASKPSTFSFGVKE